MLQADNGRLMHCCTGIQDVHVICCNWCYLPVNWMFMPCIIYGCLILPCPASWDAQGMDSLRQYFMANAQ